jgi:hypothetical protein
MMTWALPSRLAGGLAAATLGMTGLAACGGGAAGGSTATAAGGAGTQATGSGGGTAAVHACRLLTAAQASTIVGVKYTAARESMSGSAGSMCSYATTSAPIPLFIIISGNQGSAAAWKAELATVQEDAGATPITLNGVGSHAAGGGTEIGVQDGDYIIDVHGGDPLGTGHAFSKSVALAKAIIAALH